MTTKKQILSASKVADYFLFRAQSDVSPVTNKKLQKLLYYAQAWSLAARDQKLFDEKIQAWVHGPAIPEIYHAYKKFGAEPIQKTVRADSIEDISDDVKEFLDEIWKVYGKFDGAYLEQLTHSEEPWLKARQGLEAHASSENEISDESMRDFYRGKIKSAE